MPPAVRLILIGALALVATAAWPQTTRKEPYGGYMYPAGAKAGTTISAIVGGQNLQGVTAIHFTGGGVQAKAVDYGRALNQKQLRDIGQNLRFLMRQRWAELAGRGGGQKKEEMQEELPELPDHPWVRGLDKMSLKQLDELRLKLFDPKAQPNAQLGEMVFLTLTVEAGAAPGMRELRLETPAGLSNPVRFEIGLAPEVVEKEPNARESLDPAAQPLPVVFNGQIMPGDTDAFRFTARRGQRLVITAQARSLVPYLADAVPGWFQATLALYDPQGREAAFGDDYRYQPDPVIFYEVPQDGPYVLEIHDSIYRGRQDFVYRLTVGEQPFVTGLFPLGGPAGTPTTASLTGWNLPVKAVELDTAAGPALRQAQWRWQNWLSNPLPYAVNELPEIIETEPNEKAQQVSLPLIVNARISQPGDTDAFRFQGQAGEEIVAEVRARRLGSPMDSVLRLLDAGGKVLAWNDDQKDPEFGWLTHHADSHLSMKLPKTGTYTVVVGDSQSHGGDEYAYRLRLGPPQPDFALRLTPSSLKLTAGRTVPITVHVLRQEGFAGAVDIGAAGLETGFVLTGGRIPAGRDSVQMTVTAPVTPARGPVALQLEGKAQLGARTVSRPVIAAEDMMQAFAYWHLVPSQQLMVVVGPSRWAPSFQVVTAAPLRIPAGGTADVQIKAQAGPVLSKVKLELHGAPEGLTVKNTQVESGVITLTLQADAARLKPAYADNIVLEGFIETEVKRPDGKAATYRGSVGVLPAIPFEIVR